MDFRLPSLRPVLAGLFSVVIAPMAAFAAPSPGLVVAQAAGTPNPAAGTPTDHAHDAGVIEGHVVSVDYQRGVIGLLTADRGKVDVMVLPSTNIQGRGNGFHTIADIGRGSRLRVFLSQRAGQFFAQIIHLR